MIATIRSVGPNPSTSVIQSGRGSSTGVALTTTFLAIRSWISSSSAKAGRSVSNLVFASLAFGGAAGRLNLPWMLAPRDVTSATFPA